MKVGKLSNDVLSESVLSEIRAIRKDVLIRPGVGEDCAAVELGGEVCVLTTDPITGSGSNLGKLAVHVCLNDIASSGAEAVGILLTLLCPVGTQTDEISNILKEANEAANALGAEILGGHTEITAAVNKIIVSATAIGKTTREQLVKTAGAGAGDFIYLTKQVATEGTAILAHDCEEQLKAVLTEEEIQTAKGMMDEISVVIEGQIGGKVGVSAMHDATEGGVLGAIHELCEASQKGCILHKSQMVIHPITEKICRYYGIDPLKLISSGTMVITVSPTLSNTLEAALNNRHIAYSKVGLITEIQDKVMIIDENTLESIHVSSPDADELYKILG